MIPKWVPKSDSIFGVLPLGAPLVVQTAFVIKKWVPSAPKVRPKIEKAKNDSRELPDCEKELQKSSLFGAWPGGLRDTLTTKSGFHYLKHQNLQIP